MSKIFYSLLSTDMNKCRNILTTGRMVRFSSSAAYPANAAKRKKIQHNSQAVIAVKPIKIKVYPISKLDYMTIISL